MTNRSIISTESAPAAIGPYSQAVRTGNTVYCSGQIPLNPASMKVELCRPGRTGVQKPQGGG